MPGGCAAVAAGATPGLGFHHLSTAAAGKATGARGSPRGEAAADASACCALCAAHAECGVWVHRSEARRCFLGSCSTDGLPCLERLHSTRLNLPPTSVAGISPSSGSGHGTPVKICGRPAAAATSTVTSGRREAEARSAQAGSHGLALLVLGHRSRLMLDTLPANVVAPAVAAGTEVDFFALLENSTMARAFRGRRPLGNPAFAALSDTELSRHMAAAIEEAGGRTAVIRIAPRPLSELPAPFPLRLSRYNEGVRRTVATRFLKERLGVQLVMDYEATRGRPYAWILWTREDSHWFAPLDMQRFQRGAVHGKACGGFGGWNDKVWLMDRQWAPAMMSMYDAFHTAHPARCSDLAADLAPTTVTRAAPAATIAVAAVPELSAVAEGPRVARPVDSVDSAGLADSADLLSSDFLAAPSVEQFRERVGKLHHIPYTKHPPDDLPTMDSYYLRVPTESGELGLHPHPQPHGPAPRSLGPVGPVGSWRLCFPRIYAAGCVPRPNQSAVDAITSSCESRPPARRLTLN